MHLCKTSWAPLFMRRYFGSSLFFAGPRELRMTSRSAKNMGFTWKKPVKPFGITYLCEAKQGDSQLPLICAVNEEECNCTGLASTEQYTIQVTACARSNDCSPPSITHAITLPESMHIKPIVYSVYGIENCNFALQILAPSMCMS